MTTAEPLDVTVVEGLVRDAAAAPSMGGAPPWFFRYRHADRALELCVEPARTPWSADPATRALHIGCGAALLNLRAAAHRAGLRPEVELLPGDAVSGEVSVSGEVPVSDGASESEGCALASVQLVEADPRDVDRNLVSLRSAIPQRHTSRHPFADRPVPTRLRQRLADEARAEGARLTFPAEWHLAMVLDLIDDAELGPEHGGDPDEGRWVRVGTALSDAVPGADPAHGRTTGVLGRTAVDTGPTAFEHMPQIGLISTGGDEPRDWLAAGQATERLLLRATREGLVTSFAAQALERPELRWLLPDPARADGPAQLVVRFGYGPQAPHTPRRPVDDILRIAP